MDEGDSMPLQNIFTLDRVITGRGININNDEHAGTFELGTYVKFT